MSDLPTKTSSRPGDDSDLGTGVAVQGMDTAEWTPVPTNLKLENTIKLEGVPQRFSYDQLSVATGAFCEESKLGHGGFGAVYRGVLPSGSLVAVKRMNSSKQSQGTKEFKHEISILAQLRHRNLVELQGWCADRARNEYILVYELMPNGGLDDVLFKPTKGKTSLSWPQRFKILTGTAAALEYLHQGWKQQVIHRDIKCSNIMLDDGWTAKLGDFGIARLIDHEQGAATTIMAGTFGYMAPEVFSHMTFTDKADVYAFGVVVLEVACGRKVLPSDSHEKPLVPWVRDNHRKGAMLSMVDKRLSDYDPHQIEVVLQVGLLCTHENPDARPSMRRVVQLLARDVEVPAIPRVNPTSLVAKIKNLPQRFAGLLHWRPSGRLPINDVQSLKAIDMYPPTRSSDSTRALTVETATAGTSSDSDFSLSRELGRRHARSKITDTATGVLDVNLQQRTTSDPHDHDALSENLRFNSRVEVLHAGGTLRSNEALVSTRALTVETATAGTSSDSDFLLSRKLGRGHARSKSTDTATGVLDVNLQRWTMNDPHDHGALSENLRFNSRLEVLHAGGTLHFNETLVSSNEEYTFVNQEDGNLVIYNRYGRATWASGTGPGILSRGDLELLMDGNLVLFDTEGTGQPVWASMSQGMNRHDGPYRLIMQDDGNLVIYGASSVATLATWTLDTTSGHFTRVAGKAEMPSEVTWLGTSDTLVSSNRMYTFVNQNDGNLCIYNKIGRCIWASGTCYKGCGNLYMQRDGNMVFYNTHGESANPGALLWCSGTFRKGTGPYKLIMQDDGNLVIYDANSKPTWASNSVVWSNLPTTGTIPLQDVRSKLPRSDTLSCGDVLQTFEKLISRNRIYMFVNQRDGNLCVYKNTGKCTWCSRTDSAGNLHMQTDGNLVLYSTDEKLQSKNQTNPGSRMWSSGGVKGTGPYKLIIQDDGNLVIYDTNHRPTWSTHPF